MTHCYLIAIKIRLSQSGKIKKGADAPFFLDAIMRPYDYLCNRVNFFRHA